MFDILAKSLFHWLLPSHFTGANIGPDTVSMHAGLSIIVTDWLGARVLEVAEVFILGLLPARKADHICIIIADVPVRFLNENRN